MIRFVLKTLWAQRKKYYSILMEQTLITIALMIAGVSMAISLEKYLRPGLLDVSNTYALSVFYKPKEGSAVIDEMFKKGYEALEKVLEIMQEKPYVVNTNHSLGLLPYGTEEGGSPKDSLILNDKKYYVNTKYVDNGALQTFDIDLTAGKWFENEEKLPNGSWPILVSEQVVNAINKDAQKSSKEELLGKRCILQDPSNGFMHPNIDCTIIGVVSGVKESTFETSPAVVLVPLKFWLSVQRAKNLSIKIKKGYEQEFYNECAKNLKLLAGIDYQLRFRNIGRLEKLDRFDEMLSLTVQIIPTLFFIIFAFLGTFGLFWMQSKKRAKEYALQIAIGLAPQQLVSNIVWESVLLSLFASIPALIVAFFIYEWTWLHVLAIGCTILIMILFAVFSAWYPAYKVSRINPAEVLHYE